MPRQTITRARTLTASFVIILASVAAAPRSLARAEPAEPPWARGVNEAARERARAGLADGNTRFLERDYPVALEVYQAALRDWDHPAIRFNIVRCLIQLGRPVEAFEQLELALRYGSAPLEDAVYTEAVAYQKLLQGQIGDLTVRCTQAPGQVTLDGKPVIGCPGEVTRRLPPGRHQIVVRAPGFLTRTDEVEVIAGRPTALDLRLVPLADAAVQVRRWSAWKPIAVGAGGAALLAIGGTLAWRARVDLRTYEREVGRLCADDGCAPGELPGPVEAIAGRARFEDRIGMATLGVGAGTLVTGAVLVILNRPRLRYPTEEGGAGPGLRLGIVPSAGGFTVTAAVAR